MNYLPKEINENIILSLHPYYVRNICHTSKGERNKCDDWTYPALKKWVYPEKSLSYLRKLFPVIYFNDVVYLALVYNPIPESIDYFDRMTLYYHSCKVGRPNSDEFKDLMDLLVNPYSLRKMLFIAYKFDRIDILEYFLGKGIRYIASNGFRVNDIRLFINIILTKQNLPTKYKLNDIPDASGENYSFFTDILDIYPLFTYEEMVEFLVLEYKVILFKFKDNEESLTDDLAFYMYLQNGISPNDAYAKIDIYHDTLFYICYKLGINKIDQIMNKYSIPYSKDQNRRFDINNLGQNELLGVGMINSITLLNNYELVKRYIPENLLGMYYVTSGDFGAYINWLREKERTIVPMMYPYYGVNEYRMYSLDVDLYEETKDTPLGAFLSLNYPSIGEANSGDKIGDKLTIPIYSQIHY